MKPHEGSEVESAIRSAISPCPTFASVCSMYAAPMIPEFVRYLFFDTAPTYAFATAGTKSGVVMSRNKGSRLAVCEAP